ncbi:arsenate reductase ArsC [Limisalsivibrio acetivorans]|uniref:arsenate reductase ArsC n=1 Tax=Limisalsivibrio acetivorans TaxID=1304888 RepID=UPI0003B45F08|nr:arsenate reductase ArsC [Limisalsivibrio acetivorans]
MTKILFVCVHNSARSQMAEAYANELGSDVIDAESAGLTPGNLNPFAVEAMKLDGIDISGNPTKSVFDFFKEGRQYSYVITVCDELTAQRCPIFPTIKDKLVWSIEDPSAAEGTDEQKLEKTIAVRDTIKMRVLDLIERIKGE